MPNTGADKPLTPNELRERAQEQVQAGQGASRHAAGRDKPELVFELQVHEVELELQNDELRNTQLQLAESRDRFAELYEFAPVGRLTLDANGRVRSANLRMASMLGVERGSLLQARVQTFETAASRDTFHRFRQTLLSSGPRGTCELSLVKSNGTPLFVHVDGVVRGDEPDREIDLALVDISRRKAAEDGFLQLNRELEQRVAEQTRELRESEARIQAIVTAADDAIIAFRKDGLITQANPATEGLFRYEQKDLIGQNIRTLVSSPELKEFDDYATGSRPSRDSSRGRAGVGLRSDGSTFPVEMSISLVAHHDLFTCVVRDVTERQQLQRQVLDIAANEQRRIGLALLDGTAQELAALTMFASSLISTLNSLEGEVPGLSEQPHAVTLRETSEWLSRHLSQTIRNVQSLSRDVMPVMIEANGLRSALHELAHSTDAPEHVTCRFHGRGPAGVADNTTATHLFRIAQEAVKNSLKHSQCNEVTISLHDEDHHLVLEIRDNGAGISSEVVSPLDATSVVVGTGLQIMQFRAELVGATLEITPGEFCGTVIRCTLEQVEPSRETVEA